VNADEATFRDNFLTEVGRGQQVGVGWKSFMVENSKRVAPMPDDGRTIAVPLPRSQVQGSNTYWLPISMSNTRPL
jgi:hypothetical protein